MHLGNSRLAQVTFTVIEILMAVAILLLLAAVALPNFVRARKRSHAFQVVHDLRVNGAPVDRPA